ncbi:MAG: hypothetical protein COA69_07135 [Robiginitomaculum sp.]|nr:MAG: hypothetical protein COA69_07135 [Robiginitomaculum sp.]
MKFNAQLKTSSWYGMAATLPTLRPKDVIEQTGLSRSTMYEMIASGDFPPFIKIGKRASAMPKAWLLAYLDQQALSRQIPHVLWGLQKKHMPGQQKQAHRGTWGIFHYYSKK